MVKEYLKEIVIEGVVAELDGKFWGCQYEDGRSTNNDFGPIEKADISNPKYCLNPTDKTWTPSIGRYNPDFEKLKKAKLVSVKKVIKFYLND